MAIRKTKTPRWLSIARKMYTYIGAGTLVTILKTMKLTPEQMVYWVEGYLAIQYLIQVTCDAYFFKEPAIKPYKPKV